ncbi:hypothetical protein DFJ73DRAFT_89286 [Zopfochytrium polystomum]|nr:hypothetical protein DFJ73DRAFT_89286 [Zopfochytrium polystomum]
MKKWTSSSISSRPRSRANEPTTAPQHSPSEGPTASNPATTTSSTLPPTAPSLSAIVRLASTLESGTVPGSSTTAKHDTTTTTAHHWDAQAFPVRTVTVFHAVNRAEVHRAITFSLKAGRNTIVVDRLPSCIVADTLRVAGIDDTAAAATRATLVTVEFEVRDDLAAELKAVERRRRSKEAELVGLRRQLELLDDYSAKAVPVDSSAAALDKIVDVYVGRMRSIHTAIDVAEDEIEKIAAEIAETHAKMDCSATGMRSTDPGAEKLRGFVSIIVIAAGDVDVVMDLSYVVDHAQWSPVYDLRAHIAEDPDREGEKSRVMIHYRAVVSQETGEAWDNVALTLSAGRPYFDAPTLRKIVTTGGYINETFEPRFSKLSSVRPAVGSSPESDAERTLLTRPSPSSDWPSLVSIFDVAAPSTVPSGGKSAKGTKVFVAELVLESIDLEWVVVPKEAPTAFIQVCQSARNFPTCSLDNNTGHFP